MGSVALRLAFFIWLLTTAAEVQCRVLGMRKDEWFPISDGVDASSFDKESVIFTGVDDKNLLKNECEHVYGFLPCAENISGYVFQVVVFEWLLLAGDYLLSEASIRLFDVFGIGFYGAIVFRLLIMLPRIALILSSGLTASHRDAQSMVVNGVGLTSGSTVFSLTLQWGACAVFGRTDISRKDSNPRTGSGQRLLKSFNDSGVKVDYKTRRGAGVMLLSLIPFVMVQASEIFESSSWSCGVVLITLVVSTLALLSYFIYQFLDPSDQERTLEYSRYEHLLAHFVTRVARSARDKLITSDGEPNIPIISSVFQMIDSDGETHGARPELEKMLSDMNSGQMQAEKAYVLKEFLKLFDSDTDGKVSIDEFREGCERWIEKAKKLADIGECSARTSKDELHEAVNNWIESRRNELEQVPDLMTGVLRHVQTLMDLSPLKDAEANREYIERLFQKLDLDNDGKIEVDELEDTNPEFEFEKMKGNVDEAAKTLMEGLHKEGDMIHQEDLSEGITRMLAEASRLTAKRLDSRSHNDRHRKMWEEAEGLMMEGKDNRKLINKLFSRDVVGASVQILVGALIVIFLGRPLMTNIQLLSSSIRIPSFFVSFVVIPFAIHVRLALSARFTARQKMERTASLTFSEIYGGVLMNNFLGLSVILAIIYGRGLTWDYSAEVLIVLAVGLIMGLMALFCSTYPFWTCILAFSLYPLSLVVGYVLLYVLDWS